MFHVGTLPNLDRSKVGSRNSHRPLLIVRASYKCPEIQSRFGNLLFSDLFEAGQVIYIQAIYIDVIDYCSVSVYSEGTRVPKQTVLDFDVHEPFLEVKKWN